MKKTQKRILIIDDDRVYVTLLEYLLSKEGFLVETAENGDEALRKDLSALPDLIILDINMPIIDGYQLARTLKSNEKTKNIKILLCSSNSSLEDIEKGLSTGADDYIKKPFNTEEMLHRVHVNLLKGMV
ncbi:MAG: response regulator [Candidatus Tectomicrobia bacterium]|nr:response regulator [Candidatus Tectomicrobia bacterium]